jgi:hypothetical protein
MHTIQQIIENQRDYREKILSFLNQEQVVVKKILNNINSDDKYISKEKEKLKNRFKKIKYNKYIERLFFLSNSRSLIFYIWWDIDSNEAKILKYDKR